MQITMLTRFSGSIDGLDYPPAGVPIEVSDQVGSEYIERGWAEAVEAPAPKGKKATAVAPEPENTSAP